MSINDFICTFLPVLPILAVPWERIPRTRDVTELGWNLTLCVDDPHHGTVAVVAAVAVAGFE